VCHRLIPSVAARPIEAAPARLFDLDSRDGSGDPLRKNTPTWPVGT
jgi:hypothetical protein